MYEIFKKFFFSDAFFNLNIFFSILILAAVVYDMFIVKKIKESDKKLEQEFKKLAKDFAEKILIQDRLSRMSALNEEDEK